MVRSEVRGHAVCSSVFVQSECVLCNVLFSCSFLMSTFRKWLDLALLFATQCICMYATLLHTAMNSQYLSDHVFSHALCKFQLIYVLILLKRNNV